MEAMSVEQMVLSSWEGDGFIGKNRVPIASSDLDALAVNYAKKAVRLGECKVREGSQRVYVIDDSSCAAMKLPEQDFEWWMEEIWSGWLNTLPRVWADDGNPAIKWVPAVNHVEVVEVVFCCNLAILTVNRSEIDAALGKAARRHLTINPAIQKRLDQGLIVSGRVTTTLEVILDIGKFVRNKIDEEKYGRRFADPIKDLFREIHRYLSPQLNRLPCSSEGQQLETRKRSFEQNIRMATFFGIMEALGVSKQEANDYLTR
jgi:hypothetical protein